MNRIKKITMLSHGNVKRGDTIIEVMFAIAVFCLVAVISIAMMNTGVASAENSLEVVTVRNELNAQAEAIRFVHSSAFSDANLPACADSDTAGCSWSKALWNTMIKNSVSPTVSNTDGAYPPSSCYDIYAKTGSEGYLGKRNAFVLNVRNLDKNAYIKYNQDKFTQSPLNARIIYTVNSPSPTPSDDEPMSDMSRLEQNVVDKVEGLWVYAVNDGNSDSTKSKYFDFYIQSCWYGPNSSHPTALDTVIRLYNPQV